MNGEILKEKYYDYMLSYSPYDNVEAKNYPNTLITTGFTTVKFNIGNLRNGLQNYGI